MKIICSIFTITIITSLAFGQNRRITLNDPYEVFPLYYKAIESAASHKPELAKAQFGTVVSMVPFHHSAAIYLKLCDDMITGNIPSHSGFTVFKALNDFYNAKDTVQVLRTIDDVIEQNKHYYILYLIQGNLHFDLSDYNKSIQNFNQALEQEAAFATAFFLRGRSLLSAGRNEEALSDFQAALHLDSVFIPALIGSGKILYKNGNTEEAYKLMRKAMEINPVFTGEFKLVEIFNAAGIQLLERTEYDEALKAFDYAISISDDWSEPFLNRGITKRNLKEIVSAISDFDRAILIDSTLAAAYFQRGLSFMDIDNEMQAASDLEKAIILDRDNLQYLNLLGKFYFDRRQDKQAIRTFLKVLQYDESEFWPHYWIAFSYDRLKDYRNAVNYYRSFVLKVPPEQNMYKKKAQYRMAQIERWLKSQRDL